MPFVRPVDGSWRACTTVDLRQLPETRGARVRFELLDELGHTGRAPDGRDGAEPTWSRSAVDHVVPAGLVTDLASVPALLWGVIASYGRQTLPAVLHDKLYRDARAAGDASRARRLRREADILFRATLRETGAGPVRQWLMWAAVRSFGSPVVVGPLVLLALVLLAVVVLALTGWLAVPVIAWAAAGIATGGLVAAMLVVSVERDAAGRVALRPRALGSVLGAVGVALVAMAPMVLLMVLTALVRAVVELGERPVAGYGETRDPAVAATARITWSPLRARLPERRQPPPVD